MKTPMLSTALVTASAVGAMAQDTTGTMSAEGSGSNVPAFLSSEFTGMSLYTVESEDARALRDGGADMSAAERDRLRWTQFRDFPRRSATAGTTSARINDIVMTQDGEIRGVLRGYRRLSRPRRPHGDGRSQRHLLRVGRGSRSRQTWRRTIRWPVASLLEGDPVDGQAADTQMVDEGAAGSERFLPSWSRCRKKSSKRCRNGTRSRVWPGSKQRDYGTGRHLGHRAWKMIPRPWKTDPAASETDTAENRRCQHHDHEPARPPPTTGAGRHGRVLRRPIRCWLPKTGRPRR